MCYPSYNLNSTGPAVVLASFNQDDYGNRWVSTPEEEHVQYVLDAFAELHGDIVYEQYTGDYRRLCWLEEESNAGESWETPGLGQHKLYIPSYFNTEKQVCSEKNVYSSFLAHSFRLFSLENIHLTLIHGVRRQRIIFCRYLTWIISCHRIGIRCSRYCSASTRYEPILLLNFVRNGGNKQLTNGLNTELGLVDEAKEITRTWMGQWITE